MWSALLVLSMHHLPPPLSLQRHCTEFTPVLFRISYFCAAESLPTPRYLYSAEAIVGSARTVVPSKNLRNSIGRIENQQLVVVCRLCYNRITRVFLDSNITNGEAGYIKERDTFIA